MTHTYELTLLRKDTEENITLSGVFDDKDWEHIGDFVQYADELLRTKFVQDGMPASLNIRWDVESGMVVSPILPLWDDVVVFLHKFRPIGLQAENTHFSRICNILAKNLNHLYLRGMIEEQRDVYTGKRSQAIYRFSSNEVILNSEKVLYDWLNAYEYHRDKEKREFIDSLHAMIPLEASKVIFLTLLADKAMAIHNIAALVRVVLGKQESVEAIVRHSK